MGIQKYKSSEKEHIEMNLFYGFQQTKNQNW